MQSSKQWNEYKWPLSLSVGITGLVWILLFAVVMLDPSKRLPMGIGHQMPGSASQNVTAGQMSEGPPEVSESTASVDAAKRHKYHPETPKTVPFDNRTLKIGSNDMPIDDAPLVKVASETEPEQIHIALAGPGAMYISWATGNASVADNPPAQAAAPDLASVVVYGTESGWYDNTVPGEWTSYVQRYPDHSYVSGTFHHVKLTNLLPSTAYYFKCGDPRVNMSREQSFTTPQASGPTAFPQRIGIIGDLGQTYNSSETLSHLIASEPPVAILVGDLTYADNYYPNGTVRTLRSQKPYQETYQPRWDAWGRFVEPLTSQVPLMVVEGNHEVEKDWLGNEFQAYKSRFRVPHVESGSADPLYYSFDLAGSHIVMIGTYADYLPGSEQYKWLKNDLKAVDRSQTPWLIAFMHAPWYNTYVAHYKELECMRLDLEPLLYKYGVDIIFTGHVHAYERMNRVYNYTVDPCGPVHVTVGDGGNIEKLYVQWVDDKFQNGTRKCPSPTTVACPSKQEDEFCPAEQPAWSAFREPSFGHGVLELVGPTEAVWTWHANQDSMAVASDTVTITRDVTCPNQKRARD